MGRPINKRFIGNTSISGNQIQASAWIPGDSGYNSAWLNAQKGTSTYRATRYDGAYTGMVTLVDGGEGNINEGEAHIQVYPYEGGTQFARVIKDRTVTTFEGNTYSWVDASVSLQPGQAHLQST